MRSRVSRERLEELRAHADRMAQIGIDVVELGEPYEWDSTPPESYERGEVAFHAHLRIAREGSDAEPCELCACYQALPTPEQMLVIGDTDARRRSQQVSNVLSQAPHEGDMEGTVPVVSCHTVQDGKRVVRRVLSVVRLQALDECRSLRRDSKELAPLITAFGRSSVVLEKGEMAPIDADGEAVVLSRLLMVGLDECPDKVLQSGSSVVQALADQHAKEGRDRLSVLDVRGVPAALKIDIYRSHEGFSLREPAVFGIEGAQAFIRPVELCFQWDGEGHALLSS
jgi:hypothetical protein